MGTREQKVIPTNFTLTDQFLSCVLAVAEVCCSEQPVMIVGDLNATQGIADGAWMNVERAFAQERGVAPAPTCKFQLDEGKGTMPDFAVACSIALAAITSCSVRPDGWFPLHFGILTEFSISSWDASVTSARVHSSILVYTVLIGPDDPLPKKC